MIFKQYYFPCLAHASCLIGEKDTGTGVIIDPQRDIDQYVKDANDQKLQIKYVFLTPYYAAFVSGPRLKQIFHFDPLQMERAWS